jgi:hypothetical protein
MSRDPATAQRKPDTGPLTPPPAPLRPSGDRRARPPSPWRWAIVAAVLVPLIGAFFFFTRRPYPMSDQRPVEVVRGFAAAVEARDASKMLSYVEPTVFKREIGPEIRAYIEYIKEIRFDGARYELLDNDGDIAHVRWSGTMRYQIDFGSEVKSGDKPFDTTFELIKIEGAWYLRSVRLPET